jgi:hypothetical protein
MAEIEGWTVERKEWGDVWCHTSHWADSVEIRSDGSLRFETDESGWGTVGLTIPKAVLEEFLKLHGWTPPAPGAGQQKEESDHG